jgi:hypothetical protein|tara:strand:+ start:130 stop:861 length:732 start_codon:yes stop_codon:yes gene_type:complete
MTKLWHKLDLDPAGALREDLDLSFVNGSAPQVTWVWGTYDDELKDIFNESWLDYMESRNCRPRQVIIFYKPPYYRDNIHIDPRPTANGEEFVSNASNRNYKIENGDTHIIADGKFRHYTINFVGNPGYMSGNGAHRKYKNWKDTGSMRWYDTHPDDEILLTGKSINFEYQYASVPESPRVTEIDRVTFDSNGIYLANVLTPHGIVTKDQPRICFSLRGCVEEPQPSWEDTITHFKNIKLLQDQ